MKVLGTLDVTGTQSDVVLGTQKEADPQLSGETDEASYDEYAGRIWVRVGDGFGKSFTRMRDSIAHEAMHKLLDVTGAGHYLRDVTGLRGEAWERVEENFVRMLSPGLVSLAPGLVSVWAKLKNAVCK